MQRLGAAARPGGADRRRQGGEGERGQAVAQGTEGERVGMVGGEARRGPAGRPEQHEDDGGEAVEHGAKPVRARAGTGA